MRKLIFLLCLLISTSAFAGKLFQNSTPAERARGCSWGETFRSEALVELNEGAISGSPVFNPATGVRFDGTNDYITYILTGQEFGSFIAIRIVFYPDFDWDVDANVWLYDSTAGAQYALHKLNNAGGNGLRFYLGNTIIHTAASGDYSSYWRQGQKNSITISGTSGDTDMYFNDVAIQASDATAWTATVPTTLHIGSDNAGANLFDGIIETFQVYKAELTSQEVSDFHNNETYTYMDNATAVYQMRMQDHDAGNTRTLDSSGYRNNLTLVHAPVKQATHGYDLDGTNDYMVGTVDTSTFDSNKILITVEFTPDFNWDEDVIRYLYNADDGAGGSHYSAFKNDYVFLGNDYELVIYLGDTEIAKILNTVYSPFWRQGQRNVLVVSGDSVNNVTNVWLNEGHILIDDTTAWSPQTDVSRLTVGAFYTGATAFFDGVIHSLTVVRRLATSLQMHDINIKLRARRNVQ
jgi:hypothetical protein